MFRQYEQPICSYLARLTGDDTRAQELAQETFIRAYQALERGERWDNARAWLYRVASRLAINVHHRRRLLKWLPLSGTEPDLAPGVEATVIDRIHVQATLDALPQKYRVPLVLYTYEEYSVTQIAEMLGLSASAVKMRLSRARDRFCRAYEQEKSQ